MAGEHGAHGVQPSCAGLVDFDFRPLQQADALLGAALAAAVL
ncbi:hypothetical protein [Streptomyces mirabilis]